MRFVPVRRRTRIAFALTPYHSNCIRWRISPRISTKDFKLHILYNMPYFW